LPLAEDRTAALGLRETTRAVFGNPATALVQGILGGMGFAFVSCPT
jgi:hypothetical protein